MAMQFEKNSVRRSIALIVGIGLFYCVVFCYRAFEAGTLLWEHYLKYGTVITSGDRESAVTLLQFTQSVVYMFSLLMILYLFLKLKRASYVILLTLVSLSLGINIIEHFLFVEARTPWMYFVMFLGIIMTISLLQKHIQDIFLREETR